MSATTAVHKPVPIQCTGGAIPYINEKGEISMKKVKVQRYVSGKKPEFVKSSSESETEQEPSRSSHHKERYKEHREKSHYSREERYERSKEDLIRERLERHRHLHRQERAESKSAEETSDAERSDTYIHNDENEGPSRYHYSDREEGSDQNESDRDSEEDEKEIERRRLLLKQKLLEKLKKAKEEEQIKLKQLKESTIKDNNRFKAIPEEKRHEDLSTAKEKGSEDSEETEESQEDDEDDDDDEFNVHQRLKPVFVPKKDRVTIKEREDDEEAIRQAEIKARKLAEEKRRETLKILEEELKRERAIANANDTGGGGSGAILNPSYNTAGTLLLHSSDHHAPISARLDDIDTADEIDEDENYNGWRDRENARLKRDKEDRERLVREREEIERWHNMTEEERAEHLRINPKLITNKAAKGKYRFLQKYYHRGAFYLDEEEDVFKRDVSAPTLEDHFDKTIMPKIMQVKNFGKAGRTKYTHLVDQDTTAFDSPWTTHNPQNAKFVQNQAGGMKQNFVRPSARKN